MYSLIPSPTTVDYKENKNNTTEVTIEPCYPGYGVTLGNALRRVLLSSLPGSAVTAVKITGIQHEYDSIDHVKEDVVEILMNLKKLRLTSHSEEPVKLELLVKGEKIVTAGDIKKNSDVEIVDPKMVIATLTDKKAELHMELTIEQGRGYLPIEERVTEMLAAKKDIGTIEVDAIFSPIVNVGFNIERVRVGQRTDFEKIALNLTTDGSITAKEAVDFAIKILQDQLGAIENPRGPEIDITDDSEELSTTPSDTTADEIETKDEK